MRELADAYHAHSLPLVEHRHGIDAPLTPAQVSAHAVAALVYQHALAAHALHSRWCHAPDTLRARATVADVAAAMGLDADEVAVGLTNWDNGQRRHGHLTDDEHAEVLLLAAGQGGAR